MKIFISKPFSVDMSCVGISAISMIKATGRTPYINAAVVTSVPPPVAKSAVLHFFQVGQYLGNTELLSFFEQQDLIPADPHTLCVYNALNSEFADTYPNTTLWNPSPEGCLYVSFETWLGERRVNARGARFGWEDCWWFAGIKR